ncbi:MAG: methyltransferase domain-containing protein [Paracoccaceae bacterium]|nr:MAG: methyltransferase domain-containing protein [Paracoccaceae bacterium]
MAAEGMAARAAAVALLDAVLGEGRMLQEAVDAAGGPMAGLSPADRARGQRLAATVLRHLAGADAVLAPHLRKAPPRTVRNALRLGVIEIAGGAAPHGVVNALVDSLRHGRRTSAFAALANAVLRQVAAVGPDLGPPQKLPPWLRRPLVAAWGRKAVEAMEAVQSAPPPIDLTLRPGAVAAIPGALTLPTGSLRLAAGTQVTALPGYADGAFWVQDAGAALAARLLAVRPGEHVADLCAAPGGKTLQLAAAGAQVTSVDISGPRLARLRDNLARTGLSADVVVADALHWSPATPVDAVLLDAPCSATGTIRRHPDLPFVKDGSDLPDLVALQAALIDRAAGMLAPGGRMVFCTCSLLPDEGEAQLASALARHPHLRVEPPDLPGLEPAWFTGDGALRLRPDHWSDRGGIDGFYMVRLRRVD